MALGEMHGYSGRDVLSAFAAGCEVAARLSTADATRGSAGAVGAAVASSMLLGLDADGLASAVGLAVDAASGGIDYGSAGAAAMSQGRAAMQGVIAALSAEAGIDGTPAPARRLERRRLPTWASTGGWRIQGSPSACIPAIRRATA